MAIKRAVKIIDCDKLYEAIGYKEKVVFPIQEDQKREIIKGFRKYSKINHPDSNSKNKDEYNQFKEILDYCTGKKGILSNMELVVNGKRKSAMNFFAEEEKEPIHTYTFCSLTGGLFCKDSEELN